MLGHSGFICHTTGKFCHQHRAVRCPNAVSVHVRTSYNAKIRLILHPAGRLDIIPNCFCLPGLLIGRRKQSFLSLLQLEYAVFFRWSLWPPRTKRLNNLHEIYPIGQIRFGRPRCLCFHDGVPPPTDEGLAQTLSLLIWTCHSLGGNLPDRCQSRGNNRRTCITLMISICSCITR